jgi:hypothetical protein
MSIDCASLGVVALRGLMKSPLHNVKRLIMAGRKTHGMVMGELDNDPQKPAPTAPVELVKTSKVYLESPGITFRA